MAHQRSHAQQRLFRYQSLHIDKSQPLGHGSYGAVYKAKCDQLPCAAKILHPTILDPTDPGSEKIMDKFRQECAFLGRIRHPNVVQYLGMTRDRESRLPVLLMELLDENLTKMLEHSLRPLAYYVQVDICHDISLAVAYLHSNDIIHRDLSSNNVLIIAGRRAKVTDFGMAKLAGAAPSMTPLTMCPGTLAYMPPEAGREPPRYTKKLDCFSQGVIMIQVCTRLWPEPGPPFQSVPYDQSPTGMTEVPVLERERRKNHIVLIDPTHALLPIVMDCLKYKEGERPSSEELCQRLADLKDSSRYKDDVEQHNNVIQTKDNQIILLRHQLKLKDGEIQEKDREVQIKSKVLCDKEKELLEQINLQERWKGSVLEQMKLLTNEIEEQEKVIAKIRLTKHSLQKQVEQLEQRLKWYTQRNPGYKQRSQRIPLTWKVGGNTPFEVIRGSVVVEVNNKAYFMGSDGKVCSYNFITKKWSELPQYPFIGGSLAIINSQLTGIGGCKDWSKKHTYTNKLFSLYEGWLSKSWTAEVFPPMPTKRRDATAITSNNHLIVAGGANGPGFANINTVEVMHLHLKSPFWSTVASLLCPYNCVSSTVCCGDQIYKLGGWDDKGTTKTVLTCSLKELLHTSSSSPASSVWYRVADAPAYLSTCIAVNGELLAFGGYKKRIYGAPFIHAVSSIHKYDPITDSWELIGNMPTAKYYCLAVVLPYNEFIMTVGGQSDLVRKSLKNVQLAMAPLDSIIS